MEGLTYLLRTTPVGESIVVTDIERSDIHRVAKRVGVRVSCKRMSVRGDYVVRIMERLSDSGE